MTIKPARKIRGVSLLEVMTVSVLGMLVLFALIASTSISGRQNAKVTTGIDISLKARQGLDLILRDVQGAATVLSRYPVVGSSNIESNNTNTLILKLPKEENGFRVEGAWKLVLYRLVTDRGEKGPYLLRRSEAPFIDAWSDAKKSEDRFGTSIVAATNLTLFDLTYIAHERFFRDSTDSKKVLKKFPLRSASQGDSAFIRETAFLDGEDMIVSGEASYVGNQINVSNSMRSNTILDAFYNIDAGDIIGGDGKSNVSEIAVRMKLRPTWKTEGQTTKHREIMVQGRISLRNQ